jgi:hypothetical protein
MDERYKGFLAGIVSGVVKLLVGHPFGIFDSFYFEIRSRSACRLNPKQCSRALFIA